MTEPAPLLYDALDHIRVDGNEFLRLVSGADLTMSVPSCPDWRLGDLVHHVGKVWDFWASIVSAKITDRSDVRSVAAPTRPETDVELVASAFESHVRLCETLQAAGLDQQVWTWTGAAQSTAWVRRRMAQETLMHLLDAGMTLGLEIDFPSDICADGIDEFLTWFAASDRREGEMKVGGTVHLHCTDADLPEGAGEWFIAAMKEPAATFTREHRKGDVAIRGRAQDILMWLWRRDDDGLEMIGDRVVARRFRAFSELG
ncbi:MAG: maleylpyruvate isomerase family mycothiol-dependent enzyme [Actinomycetota bacterium]|nr:maleylpyruvate isomerase family mycothiol-dependent enzyme [Actinomycetota bacterium]